MFKHHLKSPHEKMSRRQFVTGIAAGSFLSCFGIKSGVAKNAQLKSSATLSGTNFSLNIGYTPVNFTGQERLATVINGSLPAPTLRWKEGERVTIRVSNHLATDSSIHWHGLILPSNMDGVPHLSFPGIKPGNTFEYQFDVNQNGTYWYHSHSGFQEQTGMYGAIIIEPKQPDPVSYDREHVIMLSDWSDEDPNDIYAKLKKKSHYFSTRERTVNDLYKDIKNKGVSQTWRERAMWNEMRMSEYDISDVTGYTYTFLMNGVAPAQNWTGTFQSGEKVRLRVINGAAMTMFDFRIPGLKMTVVAADGQNIEPVTVDEFRIGVAETYDVIVEPKSDSAYCLFAQSIDRSGYARGTLTPDPSWSAEIPAMDYMPVLQHRDMGMGHHSGGNHSSRNHSMGNHSTESHNTRTHKAGNQQSGLKNYNETTSNYSTNSSNESTNNKNKSAHMHHHQNSHQMNSSIKRLGLAGFGSSQSIVHLKEEYGPHVDMRAESPVSGLADPGIGLRDHMKSYQRRVLAYSDIKNLYTTQDKREPSREIQLHLTGNMKRYMWSINGVSYSDAEPLDLQYGERVRFHLVNDTMMTHPIHLHGMWSELETGDTNHIPRKHTVLVQPGSSISYLVTADALGRWAYHCHLLFHMSGMAREFTVKRGKTNEL